MSQPESAVADQRTGASPAAGESLANVAAHYGLRRSIARPPVGAYLRQLWHRRHFIVTFATSKNLSAYTNSALGQLWQVLTPLLNAAIYFLVFGFLLGQRKNVPTDNYTAFLVIGIFVFTYTQRSLMAGSRAIANNLSLVRAMHFPRAALPLAYTLVELQQLGVSMVVLFTIVLINEPVTWLWLLVLPALLLQTMFNVGMSMVVARIGARMRDISQLLPFMMRTWLYFSGVFWSIDRVITQLKAVPQPLIWLLEVNPAAVFIELVRGALISDYSVEGRTWAFAGAWAVVALVGGFVYFWRAEERYGRG